MDFISPRERIPYLHENLKSLTIFRNINTTKIEVYSKPYLNTKSDIMLLGLPFGFHKAQWNTKSLNLGKTQIQF